ncbi:MAG: YdcF family protein [Bacteroidetes bacterium]|nr:YdcF family protein [Bacteroidota bacterium]
MKNLLLLLLCTILFSSCSLALKRADKLYKKAILERPYYDAVIVPGVPFKNGAWDSVMKARVLWSVYLYQHKFTRNIIFSGAAVYTPFYEAVIMGLYAQKLGVNKNHIFYDTLAKHSTENVYYSYKLAKNLGFTSLALATDPFQSALLNAYTKRRFMSPIAHLPVNFTIIAAMNTDSPYIDSMTAFKEGFKSILEQESLLKRLKGTMGKQVKYGTDKALRRL